MTRGETARLLALVKAAFPLFRLPDGGRPAAGGITRLMQMGVE